MRYYAVRFGLHRKAMSWTSHRYYYATTGRIVTTRTHLQTHRPVLLAIVNIKTSNASLRVSLHCLTGVCILSVLGTSTEHLATDLPATMLPLDLEISSPLNRTPAMTVEGLDPTLPPVLEPFCREVSAVEVLDHSHLLTSEPFNLHVASMATPMERTRTRKVIIITRLR